MSLRNSYRSRLAAATLVCAATLVVAACQSQPSFSWPWSKQVKPSVDMPMTLSLSGANEVPPVTTPATGSGTITVSSDRTVRGSVSVTGMTPTAAHIHVGAADVSGPVIIPLVKASDSSFNVPPDAKLTDPQWADFQAGKLYVNVHSAKYPNGEVRAQLKNG